MGSVVVSQACFGGSSTTTGGGGPTIQVSGGGGCAVQSNSTPGGINASFAPGGVTISGTGSGMFDNTGFFPVGFSGTGGPNNTPLSAVFQINGNTVATGASPGFFQLGNTLAGQALSTWQVTLTGTPAFLSGLSPFQMLPNNSFNYCVWLGTNTACTSAAQSSQSNPIFPTSPVPLNNGGPPRWGFQGVQSGGTFDPPFVNGFEYAGTGGTRFDRITLPTGFGSSFTVWTGAGFTTSLGTFPAGAAVDFVLGGVDAFQIRNIQPSVDAALANAFPLQIFFEGGGLGNFTQTGIENGVPEPSTWLLMAVAVPFALRRFRS